MKDRALEIGRSANTELAALNKLREYLQHVIMRELFELDVLGDLVFHGGTALKFIYGLERFSEDLDFHLARPNHDWELQPKLNDLQAQIEYQGYDFAYSEPSAGNVKSSFLKFNHLLYEAGLSNHKHEKLQVKIEVDTNPPAGFETETQSINHFFPYVVQHHDKPSFLAGKLHAILQRDWTKGRDFYDLWFYLTRWQNVDPNIVYLQNALAQTDYNGEAVTKENWKELTAEIVKAVDWDDVTSDVEPFLLRQSDLKAFRKELLLSELNSNEE